MLWSELFFKQLKFLKENVSKEAAQKWDFWEHEGTDTENETLKYRQYEEMDQVQMYNHIYTQMVMNIMQMEFRLKMKMEIQFSINGLTQKKRRIKNAKDFF